jgi:ATP-dependent DNA ligase
MGGPFKTPRSWNQQALAGHWQATIKMDGVRAIWHEERGWLSRAGKPLYNIPSWQPGCPRDCEIFVGNFRDTVRATLTKSVKRDTPAVLPMHLYGLEPLDARLHWDTLTNPTPDEIHTHLQRVNDHGHEGLVLRQADYWIKIKPEETHDVAITGFVEGRGKHLGRLGYVTTIMGNVSSGFSDYEREVLWAEAKAERLVGQVIEVKCQEVNRNNRFRHPSFFRMRPDKLAS